MVRFLNERHRETSIDTESVWSVYEAVFGDFSDKHTWRAVVWDKHTARHGFRVAKAFEDEVLVGFAYGYTGDKGQWWTDNALETLNPDVGEAWLGGHFELVSLGVRESAEGNGTAENSAGPSRRPSTRTLGLDDVLGCVRPGQGGSTSLKVGTSSGEAFAKEPSSWGVASSRMRLPFDALDHRQLPCTRCSTRDGGQVCDATTSTTGQAPPIVVEMTVAVVPRCGWWLDQNETPASAPDIVIWLESASSQKPRP